MGMGLKVVVVLVLLVLLAICGAMEKGVIPANKFCAGVVLLFVASFFLGIAVWLGWKDKSQG